MITISTTTISLLMCLISSLDRDQQLEEHRSFLLVQISKKISLFNVNLEIRYYLESSFQIIIFNAHLLLENLQELFQWVSPLKKDSGLQVKQLSFIMTNLQYPKLNQPVDLSTDTLKSQYLVKTLLILELEKFSASSTEQYTWMEQSWSKISLSVTLLLLISGSSLKISILSSWSRLP